MKDTENQYVEIEKKKGKKRKEKRIIGNGADTAVHVKHLTLTGKYR